MIKKLYDQSILWQMSAAERMAMFYIIDRLPQRRRAVEIGSYKGGFLRELAKHFDSVVSVDIDHQWVTGLYDNVLLATGTSDEKLPSVLEAAETDFILIDGDHSYEGVLSDLRNVITYAKGNPIILLHDAAWHESRKAIVQVAQELKENYHVDIDFVPGVEFRDDKIGGLALFIKHGKITEL